MSAKVLVLCSGGLQSTLLTSLATKEASHVCLLFYNHGQVNQRGERLSFHHLSDFYDIERYEETISIGVKEKWPRFKLTIMLLHAFIIAKKAGCNLIYYGANQELDVARYERTERTLEYLETVHLLGYEVQPQYDEKGFLQERVEVQAPLLLLTWKQIAQLGVEWEAPWHLAWSCETSTTTKPCNECQHCLRHNQLLATAEEIRSRRK